ncbi:MAG: rhomboid family intramembrane serine protease, partial [Desulfobacterales bacterium]
MAKQRKGSILCPHCNKLISADEPRCPYCNTTHPGSWWKDNALIRGLANADLLISAILYVNIGMYVISLLIEPAGIILSLNDPFRFLSPGSRSLLLLGATGSVPIDTAHRWWSLLAANYLHGNILHILFNMLAFRQLSALVLAEYGTHRTIVLYTLGGVLGFFVSYLAGVEQTIGASASICSLIGAMLYFGKSRGGAYGQAVYKQV